MSILKQALQLSVDDFHLVGRLLLVNAVMLTEEESKVWHRVWLWVWPKEKQQQKQYTELRWLPVLRRKKEKRKKEIRRRRGKTKLREREREINQYITHKRWERRLTQVTVESRQDQDFKDFNSFLQIFYWECSVILFHLLVSQLGSEEQEQPAKNCPYRLQDTCSAPERPGSFLWTADLTESPLYFNEKGSSFKPGIYYSPIRSSS